jgi:hypothetical protein
VSPRLPHRDHVADHPDRSVDVAQRAEQQREHERDAAVEGALQAVVDERPGGEEERDHGNRLPQHEREPRRDAEAHEQP